MLSALGEPSQGDTGGARKERRKDALETPSQPSLEVSLVVPLRGTALPIGAFLSYEG